MGTSKHKMEIAPALALALALALLCLFSVLSCAAKTKRSYVVYMGSHGHLPAERDCDLITEDHRRNATEKHHRLLASVLGSPEAAREAITHSYNKYINGFSAVLDKSEAERLAGHPDVITVFPSKARKLQTTNSMKFLSLEEYGEDGTLVASDLWRKGKQGEGVIIGNIDTGVWPESESFSDDGYGRVPRRWRGWCQNDSDQLRLCNRKLIGFKYFNKAYLTYAKDTEVATARDQQGHGTHTLSTAGGSFVQGASVFGLGRGTAKGSAPRARVAAYKACWKEEFCFDQDIVEAFDEAICDGVDVLSVSIGQGPQEFFRDGVMIGSFHAVRHGIAVVAAAGNDGPKPGTVINAAPWVLTVAASTTDREFQAAVRLGNGSLLTGSSVSPPLQKNKKYRLIDGIAAKRVGAKATEALRCLPKTLDSKKAFGKIVVCFRGDTPGTNISREVKLAGGVGMILCNSKGESDTSVGPYVLPAVNLNYAAGRVVLEYLKFTENPVGYITPPSTVMDAKPSPSMAHFSSQGPNTVVPTILKPDITAPGVQILAAFNQRLASRHKTFHPQRIPFTVKSGTSMSCPHVAGILALLKVIHPDWSQAALMSSLMTTSYPINGASQTAATPFNYGSGHIQPRLAANPGLVYDATFIDYLNFLCSLGYNSAQMELFYKKPYKCPPESSPSFDLNYPSISVPDLSGEKKLTRKLTNVANHGTYNLTLEMPPGISVQVHPEQLIFMNRGEELSFDITLKPKKINFGEKYVFGTITWSDGTHDVRSPIAVSVRRN